MPATVAALGAAKRVEGEINEHWVNLALSRAPVVEGVFLWAGASLLERTGIVPGETLEVRLRPAPDDQVDTPEDVASALRAAGFADVGVAGARIGDAAAIKMIRSVMVKGIEARRTISPSSSISTGFW